ncbi:hypothetical protein HGM15179_002422 [Zosterops borbonicus]|uniref:Uncharacterized protein n=1 Tax=Zosterops borbonicus TaxID=364589 RepID=A0A8K1GSW1_9PASS|nr:hypothetical protein HGM15179_002422 [Zosterops borbonicus]
MAASSKTELLLAKQTIGDRGTSAEITHLRRWKIYCQGANFDQRGERTWERNSSADSALTKVSEEVGQEVLHVPEERFPCSL